MYQFFVLRIIFKKTRTRIELSSEIFSRFYLYTLGTASKGQSYFHYHSHTLFLVVCVLLLTFSLASTDVFTFKSNYWCLISYMFCWYKTTTTMYLPIFSGVRLLKGCRSSACLLFHVYVIFYYYCNYWILVIIKCMSFLGTVRVIRAWETFNFLFEPNLRL